MYSVGQAVEVWCGFSGRWTDGFEVHAVGDEGIVLRRTSDGAVLSRPFAPHDVRVRDPHCLHPGSRVMR